MHDDELARRLRQAVSAGLADAHFGLPGLMQTLGLSERTLHRRIRRATGSSPAAYLRGARLAYARQLLETRARKTVAEVAYAAGFSSPGYFAAVFFRHYGRRASEYLR